MTWTGQLENRGDRRRGTVVALLLACALMSSALAPSASSAAAAAKPSKPKKSTVSLAGPSAAVRAGQRVKLTGKVKPAAKRAVTLTMVGGRTVKTAKTTASGAFTLTFTAPSRTSSYRVTASATKKFKKATSPARTIRVTKPPTPQPSVPPVTGLSAVPTSPVGARLTWGLPSAVRSEIVVSRLEGTTTPTMDDAIDYVGANSTSYDDEGTLAPATTYTYAVFTRDLDYRSSAAAVVRVTTPERGPLPAPTGLRATANRDAQVSLTWDPTTSPEVQQFLLVRRTGAIAPTSPDDPDADLFSFDATETSYLDAYTDEQTTYSYALFASDYDRVSEATTVTVTTPVIVYFGSPTQVRAGSIASSRLTLSWDASDDPYDEVSGYEVRRSVGTSAPISRTDGQLVGEVDQTTTSMPVSGLSPTTTYSFSVFARNAAGDTPPPGSVTATTAAVDITPPGQVTGLTLTPGSSRMELAWTNPSDADLGGVIIRRTAGPTPPATPTSGTAVAEVTSTASYVDRGLSAASTYSYALFTYDLEGNSSGGAVGTSTTLGVSRGGWPMAAFGPGHDSFSANETVVDSDNADGLAQEWTIPDDQSTFLVDDGVLIRSLSDSTSSYLSGTDLTTAQEVWRFEASSCLYPNLQTVTSELLLVLCNGVLRAYDRIDHDIVWDLSVTDPGQSYNQASVLGNRVIAWGPSSVGVYRTTDAQRVWQVTQSGGTSISEVAAGGDKVIVRDSSGLRAMSLTSGATQWTRSDVPADAPLSGGLVISDADVFVNLGGHLQRLALTSGALTWEASPDAPVYKVLAADQARVYVAITTFADGAAYGSIDAFARSDGAPVWSTDLGDRVSGIAVTGSLVWVSDSNIFAWGRYSSVRALDKQTGNVAFSKEFDDNIYSGQLQAAGGKVIFHQGGSSGGATPRTLRVWGLSGKVPVPSTRVLPLAETGSAYDTMLGAELPSGHAATWTLRSGSLPAGLSLAPSGQLSGSPAAVGSARLRFRVTDQLTGRFAEVTTTLATISAEPAAADWSTSGQDATRNPFVGPTATLNAASAPQLGPRGLLSWGEASRGLAATAVVGAGRAYARALDGRIKAWDLDNVQGSRPPLWQSDPSLDFGTSMSPTYADGLVLGRSVDGTLVALDAADGSEVWRSDAALASVTQQDTPLVVGDTVYVVGARAGAPDERLFAYNLADGAPRWAGSGSAEAGMNPGAVSSNGVLLYAIAEGSCELVARARIDGSTVWRTSFLPAGVECDPRGLSQAPVVAEGRVHATLANRRLVVDAQTGEAVSRFVNGVPCQYFSCAGASSLTDSVVVGGLWIAGEAIPKYPFDLPRLTAVDPLTGDVLWRNTDLSSSIVNIAAVGDLLLVLDMHRTLIAIDRTTGRTLSTLGILSNSSSTPVAITVSGGRVLVATDTGIRIFGPLDPD